MKTLICFATLPLGLFFLNSLGVRFSFVPVEEAFVPNFIMPTCFILAILTSLFFVVYYILLINKNFKDLELQKGINQQAAKLASIGEMATGLTHEINNPVAVIKAQAHALSRLIQDTTLEHQTLSKGLGVISQMCDRIVKIVNGLKAFSRKEEGEIMVPVTISSLIENAINLCEFRFKDSHVEIRYEKPSDTMVSCRPVQIEQVFVNLLNNAHDAVIAHKDRWVKIAFASSGSTIQVLITDSGQGIAPEVAQKMMQPFFTTKPVGVGTGLGLSLACGLIAEHSGRLTYNAQSPNTQFIVELPIHRAEGATSKAS